MPLYDFQCPTCGAFRAMRPMAQSAEPSVCSGCGASAPRTLSAPAILRGAPVRSGRAGPETAIGGSPSGPAHPAGCGCCARRSPVIDNLAAAGGRVFTSNGPLRAEGL